MNASTPFLYDAYPRDPRRCTEVGSMTTDSRTIRVFVNSTFQDLIEERDELVLRTFPQLRQLCESRGVSWTEVDLRCHILYAIPHQ